MLREADNRMGPESAAADLIRAAVEHLHQRAWRVQCSFDGEVACASWNHDLRTGGMPPETSPKLHAKTQSSKEFLRYCSRLLDVRRKNFEILLCDSWAAGVREIIVLSVESLPTKEGVRKLIRTP